ncbi:NB-ARC domain-containing protein [Streptomyces cavourensis]
MCPRDEIPGEESERESLYRSLTAGRRLLVVLDNASGAAQVRPLIPGSGGSRLLVTSRRRLADLEGARTLLLGPLDEAGSLELLGSVVGTARVGGEPRAARTVVTVCAGLPLAIRIAGIRLLERPHWSIGHLARRLTDAPRLLDELCAGDAGVRPCLDAEVAGLRRSAPGGIDPAEVLAALGTAGASSVSGGEVAVMFGCPEAQAEEALDSLVGANLLGAPAGAATGWTRCFGRTPASGRRRSPYGGTAAPTCAPGDPPGAPAPPIARSLPTRPFASDPILRDPMSFALISFTPISFERTPAPWPTRQQPPTTCSPTSARSPSVTTISSGSCGRPPRSCRAGAPCR